VLKFDADGGIASYSSGVTRLQCIYYSDNDDSPYRPYRLLIAGAVVIHRSRDVQFVGQ